MFSKLFSVLLFFRVKELDMVNLFSLVALIVLKLLNSFFELSLLFRKSLLDRFSLLIEEVDLVFPESLILIELRLKLEVLSLKKREFRLLLRELFLEGRAGNARLFGRCSEGLVLRLDLSFELSDGVGTLLLEGDKLLFENCSFSFKRSDLDGILLFEVLESLSLFVVLFFVLLLVIHNLLDLRVGFLSLLSGDILNSLLEALVSLSEHVHKLLNLLLLVLNLLVCQCSLSIVAKLTLDKLILNLRKLFSEIFILLSEVFLLFSEFFLDLIDLLILSINLRLVAFS